LVARSARAYIKADLDDAAAAVAVLTGRLIRSYRPTDRTQELIGWLAWFLACHSHEPNLIGFDHGDGNDLSIS
jgi:hypothetical protein